MLQNPRTDLVYHVRQLTLHLVRVNVLLTAEPDGGGKRGNRHSRTPSRCGIRCFRLGVLETACCENFSQQVTQAGIVSPLQRQIDSTLHELILATLQSLVEGVDVALPDAFCQWQKELLEPRVRFQQSWGRESMRCEEVTRDEVSQDQSRPQKSVYVSG